MTKTKYISKGIVLGNYWGGGKGAYKAETLTAKTKKDLLAENKKMLGDGSLDSGMGYESLIGARLYITKITTKIIGEKPFTNEETTPHFIGSLDDKEKEFLLECQLHIN